MFDEDEYIHEYIFSGSLPENASTYVKREADDELYHALKQGKFCYVLNSRQSGKSSLRVRTMSRLSSAGVECASIDLSSVSIQSATQENWYADLIVKLIDSFVLELDFKQWWEKNQINSPLMRFSNFLEKHLLVEIEENIVIFIDEIDSVLSLNFPTDDFFAFIRACYNQRVDNAAYKRLTFCLLGVASPSNLIEDKSRTPFNIGKAISLKGFQLHETEPLIKGLQGKFSEPQVVMEEILDWTGGQPFLTQKLCQFMVEESEQENPHTVKEIVKSRIIENWESQDEPEHLRTIRSRIFRNEERAGYLLDLYQKIRSSEEQSDILDPPNPPYKGGLESSSLSISITADNTIEQSELLLSGLVAKRKGTLRVYNKIYQKVFNQNWVENELKNLRPYSESFKFWVASGGKDESRLLRGNALADAEEWAKDKNLSYQDKQFLAASREKEIEEKIAADEQAARLDREKKDREALEKRNKVLSEANNKANRRIRNGTFVLILCLFAAGILGILAVIWGSRAQTEQKNAEASKQQAQAEQKNAEAAKKQAQAEQKNAEAAKKQAQSSKRRVRSEQERAEKARRTTIEAFRSAKAAKQKEEDLRGNVALVEEGIKTLQKLSQLAGDLHNGELISDSEEALRLAGLSFGIKDHKLKQAMLLASISQAYQNLEKSDKAQNKIRESLNYINKKENNITSNEELQVKVFVKKIQGEIYLEINNSKEALKAYEKAYNILKNNPSKTKTLKNNQIITYQEIESIYQILLNLSVDQNKLDFRQKVWDSLKQHFYAKIKYFLSTDNWREADMSTLQLMLFIADRQEEGWLDIPQIEKFPCPDLKKIDKLWKKNSDGHFGFSVQEEIWFKTGNKLGITPKDWKDSHFRNYLPFAKTVGWYKYDSNVKKYKIDNDFIEHIQNQRNLLPSSIRGGLPGAPQNIGEEVVAQRGRRVLGGGDSWLFFRVATCKL